MEVVSKFQQFKVSNFTRKWKNSSTRPTLVLTEVITIFTQVVRPSVLTFQNKAKKLPVGTCDWPSGSLKTPFLYSFFFVFQNCNSSKSFTKNLNKKISEDLGIDSRNLCVRNEFIEHKETECSLYHVQMV